VARWRSSQNGSDEQIFGAIFRKTFSDLDIQEVDTNADNIPDTSVIDLGGNNSITVLGVIGLTATDFDFILV
jgi:hypothetical protein